VNRRGGRYGKGTKKKDQSIRMQIVGYKIAGGLGGTFLTTPKRFKGEKELISIRKEKCRERREPEKPNQT